VPNDSRIGRIRLPAWRRPRSRHQPSLTRTTQSPVMVVFRVGPDIAPGLYRTGGTASTWGVWINNIPTQDEMCSWFTYSTPDANKDNVVQANSSMGPMYANINTTIKAFESQNCQPWTRGPISRARTVQARAISGPGNNPDYSPIRRMVPVSPTQRRLSMTAAVSAQKLSAGTWAIDPVHSSINFSVRHLMVGKIHGRFDQFSGGVTVTQDGTPSVSAEVDVNSIDTGNEQREAHIKAPDFFDVTQFPTATFVSTAVRADGDDYVLDGDFTLKGVTTPVTMTLAFNGVNPGMGRGEVAGFDASVCAEPQGLRSRRRVAA